MSAMESAHSSLRALPTGIDAYFSGVSQRFAARYAQDDAFRERYQLWTNLLDRYSANQTTAIDLGCGSGIFSFYLAERGLSVAGIDAAAGMIHYCRQQQQQRAHAAGGAQPRGGPVTFHQAELPHLTGIRLAPADVVIASSVLEYVADLSATLATMKSLVRDTGTVIVSLPNRASYYRKIEKWRHRLTGQPAYYAHVRNVVTLAELTQAAATVGLKLREHAYYAHDTRVGALLRSWRFPPHRTEDLLAAVFQPANHPTFRR